MSRAIILVLDSLGVGAAPDAERFGDQGANTLGHIASYRAGKRLPLRLPHLERLGLAAAMQVATGQWPEGLKLREGFTAAYGAAQEISIGKDTPSGHWEMTGVPVLSEWGYFRSETQSFPDKFLQDWMHACLLPGVLGNCHASGTQIIEKWGDRHMETGAPIVYTSADSVFQVAAHEDIFPVNRLYEICNTAFELLRPYNIARVIARPFSGSSGAYQRTANRKDIAVAPPGVTLLDLAAWAGRNVYAIGKIADIFSMKGITSHTKTVDNADVFNRTLDVLSEASEGSIVFANFVDFDQNFGHRRDVEGYAKALEYFDKRWPELEARLGADDLCVLTADHGCDPTWPGSDHTREFVPQIYFGKNFRVGPIGRRSSFADIGQTLATHLGLPSLQHGVAI